MSLSISAPNSFGVGTSRRTAPPRSHAPRCGRFLQADPLGYGDGMNMYAYVKGDPVNKIDPLGLCGFGHVEVARPTNVPDTREPGTVYAPYRFYCTKVIQQDGGSRSGGDGGRGRNSEPTDVCDAAIQTPAGPITPRQSAARARAETLRDVVNGVRGTPPGLAVLGAAGGWIVSAARNALRLKPGGNWDPKSSADGNYIYGAVTRQGLGVPLGLAQWTAGVVEKYLQSSNSKYDSKNGDPFNPFDAGNGDTPESQGNIEKGSKCAP